ncbi:MAG: hypothetical protein WBK20_01585 [Spirochaetota bacterium]
MCEYKGCTRRATELAHRIANTDANAKQRKVEYFKRSMLYHLAWIGYRVLKNKHCEVTYDVVQKYTAAPRAMIERAIAFFKEIEKEKEEITI